MKYLIQVTGPDPKGYTEVLFKSEVTDKWTADKLYEDLSNQYRSPFTVSMIEVES